MEVLQVSEELVVNDEESLKTFILLLLFQEMIDMFNANNYGYNPYGRYTIQQPMEQLNNQQGAQQMFVQSTFNKPMLNGKQVESIDVVKAMDIPLDGSIS